MRLEESGRSARACGSRRARAPRRRRRATAAAARGRGARGIASVRHEGDRCTSRTVANEQRGRERDEDPRLDRLERPEPIGRLERERAAPAEREQVLLRVDPRLLRVQDREVLARRGDVAADGIDERVAQHPVARVRAGNEPRHRLVLGRRVVRPQERCRPQAGRRRTRPASATSRPGVRRSAPPASTPSASAKRAYAGTTRPWISKPLGLIRPSSPSNGCRHHVTIALSTTPPTVTASASSSVFESSHRRRVTLCVHANRCVPCSSSRASSGAPTNMPDERRQQDQVARDVDAAAELALEVAHDDVAARARGRRQAGGERFALVGRPHRQPGDQRGERETDDQCEADEQLVAVLPPGHPCHRSRPFSGARGPGRRSGAM